jgi:hypothetical protein
MAGAAGGVAGRTRRPDQRVPGGRPLFEEGGVHAGVTGAAAGHRVGTEPNVRQRLDHVAGVDAVDVLLARTVARLALDVTIGGVGDDIVAGRLAGGVVALFVTVWQL